MANQETRFEALDAWRGLSAVLVAMFHLQTYSHIYGSPFLQHSYLFVDFFLCAERICHYCELSNKASGGLFVLELHAA